MTPLHVAAAKGGRISILKYIIDKEDIKDDNGVSETRVLIQQRVVVKRRVHQSSTFHNILGNEKPFLNISNIENLCISTLVFGNTTAS